MWTVPILCGIGCAVALLVTAFSRDSDAIILAIAMGAVLVIANILWLTNQLWAMPVLDWYLGWLAVTIWWSAGTKEAAILVHLVIVRLAAHAIDTLTGHAYLVTYLWVLNIAFALQLLVIISWGGRIGQLLDFGARCLRRLGGALLPSSALRRLNNGR